MTLLPSLLNLSVIYLLAAMLPGPNVLVVSHLSAGTSRKAGIIASLGVTTGTIGWVTLSLGGVGVLLMEAGWIYRTIRVIAAFYLIYAGWRMLRASPGQETTERPRTSRSPFLAGLLTNLSNPKSAVFWTSVFIVLVPPNAPLWFHAAVLATIAIEAMIWYGSVALLLSSGPARRQYARFARWLDRITGVVMIVLGLTLIAEVGSEIGARRDS